MVEGIQGAGEGAHVIPFTPEEVGVYQLLMYFNGVQIHDKMAKLKVHKKGKSIF